MSELYLMKSIFDRDKTRKVINFLKNYGVDVNMVALAYGTAGDETVRRLGLETGEKVIISSVVTGETWKVLKPAYEKELKVDLPGNGMAFIIPMASIGGKSQLQFLTGNQTFELNKEESVLKDTRYELLIVISNIGYSDPVMDAAREAGAGGGTVIHAKGTGMQGSEAFLGVTLASEKELIYIVVKRERRDEIMKAIMGKAGLDTKAQAIVFSLPVTAAAGMRLAELDEKEAEDA